MSEAIRFCLRVGLLPIPVAIPVPIPVPILSAGCARRTEKLNKFVAYNVEHKLSTTPEAYNVVAKRIPKQTEV